MTTKRRVTLLLVAIAATFNFSACGGRVCEFFRLCLPNTSVTVQIVNDTPNGTAFVRFIFNLVEAPFSVFIGPDGRGSVTYDTGAQNIGTVFITCANGKTIQPATGISLSPASNSSVTVDCQTATVVHNPASCQSLYNATRRIDRIEPPVLDATCNGYPSDFSVQTTRTQFVTDFSAQTATHQAEANQLYSWLLNTTPPDSTVLNNLNVGQSLESQVIYIASGSAFFSAAGGTNSNFVTRCYHLLLARDPTSTESSNAVHLLNGFWGNACVYCASDPPCGTCWVQDTRDQWLADTIVYSNEFYQVSGTVLLYGAHLGRAPSSTEISNLATQMVTSGFLQGGAIPITSSSEFFQDSATLWYAQ